MAKALANSIKAELSTKAHFVAGAAPWKRKSNDYVTKSAIHDAEQLLMAIGDKIKQPKISGGTTTDPNEIISLSWRFFNHSPYKLISISCTGNGKYEVHWDSIDEHSNDLNNLTLSEVLDINIPEKVRMLTNGKRQSSEPTTEI